MKKLAIIVATWMFWCFAWIPLGLLFPFQGHGGVPGWFAPIIGFFVFPALLEEPDPHKMSRLDLFMSFILPWFLFWAGMILWPMLTLRILQEEKPSNPPRE